MPSCVVIQGYLNGGARMTENKELIVRSFFDTLKSTRAGQNIASMRYEGSDGYMEFVIIEYTDGTVKIVQVTADSGIAMLRDILKKLD